MRMAAEYTVMSEKPDANSPDSNEEIEREIRTNRKFSLSEAIGRMAGGLMKGGSPVTRKRQAELEIDEYLRRHLVDSAGVLRSVLFSAQWRLRSATRSPCGVHPKNSYVGTPPGGVRPRSRCGVGTSA